MSFEFRYRAAYLVHIGTGDAPLSLLARPFRRKGISASQYCGAVFCKHWLQRSALIAVVCTSGSFSFSPHADAAASETRSPFAPSREGGFPLPRWPRLDRAFVRSNPNNLKFFSCRCHLLRFPREYPFRAPRHYSTTTSAKGSV